MTRARQVTFWERYISRRGNFQYKSFEAHAVSRNRKESVDRAERVRRSRDEASEVGRGCGIPQDMVASLNRLPAKMRRH